MFQCLGMPINLIPYKVKTLSVDLEFFDFFFWQPPSKYFCSGILSTKLIMETTVMQKIYSIYISYLIIAINTENCWPISLAVCCLTVTNIGFKFCTIINRSSRNSHSSGIMCSLWTYVARIFESFNGDGKFCFQP